MRRWNGWGDDSIDYPLPSEAFNFLTQRVGQGTSPRDATRSEVLASIPRSRLPDHPLISKKPLHRLCHARGQSLPDWIELRSGNVRCFPDGVAFPQSDDDIQELIRFAGTRGAHLIPFGGGTSVVGHINPLAGDAPVLTMNMRRLNRLLRMSAADHMVTFGAGVQGPELEAELRAQGFTLGHFPQSFEYSTLGGWIATRSSGQQSLGYGRIEDLFVGGRLISPAGQLELPPFPASAAGPDLRHIVLGSEGRLGVLSQATVRITPIPEREDFHAVFFPNFDSGLTAVRQIMQEQVPLVMLRLSTADETTTTLALAGHTRLIGTLERLLTLRDVGDGKCLLLLGFAGEGGRVRAARRAAIGIAKDRDGVHVGRTFGNQWHKGRFRTPYLRNSLWDAGFAVDTVETATSWSKLPDLMAAIESALRGVMENVGERILIFSHLSHIYRQGASIYTTFLFRLASDPDESFARWQLLKQAVSNAIVAEGVTISHQHGIGVDHAPYLEAEKGKLGMGSLADLLHRFDPQGIMNPGKLLP